jgi:two-component system KDP operon response regulator KdpE
MHPRRESMVPRASLFPMIGSGAVHPLVLVVADDSVRRRSLVSTLAFHGFRSLEAGVDAAAVARAIVHRPDLLLVDVNQTAAEVVDVAARLREGTSTPILALLARPDEPLQAAVLDRGANDYIVRPFGIPELLARMRVWLRQVAWPRSAKAPMEERRERLRVDLERRSLFVDGREVHITPIERRLVIALVQRAGQGLTETQAVVALWGRWAPAQVRYLRMLIRQLQQKIEREPSRPRHLLSTAEGGYRLRFD